MNNFLRLIVLLEASGCLWFTAVVLVRYRRRYLQAAQMGTAGRRRKRGRTADTPWIGLLPLHVWMVTAAVFVFQVQSVALVTSNLGRDLIWYGTPLSLIAFPLLLASLFAVAQYENRVSGRN